MRAKRETNNFLTKLFGLYIIIDPRDWFFKRNRFVTSEQLL